MASASWSLQKAIHARLTSDAALSGLLGGQRVYDDVPRGIAHPYITFGLHTERDWSTGSDTGSEHLVTLNVWSEAAGRREVDDIMAAVQGLLHDQSLTLSGHRLVNMRQEAAEARRNADGMSYRGTIRLRAVTEPV